MDKINKDVINEICKYLSHTDLFHFLICNKILYQCISIYRQRYIFNYKQIKYNHKDYRNVIIRPRHRVPLHQSWIQNLADKVLCKDWYYIYFESDYSSKYKDSSSESDVRHLTSYIKDCYGVYVEPLRLNLNPFQNLYKLEFDNYYNQPFTTSHSQKIVFPLSLRHIKFGKCFNQEIDYLPDHIEIIEFDSFSYFNIETKKYPNNLKYIKYGSRFSKSIDYLPDTVEQIDMKNSFFNLTPILKLPSRIKFLVVNRKEIVQCELQPKTLVYYAIDTLDKSSNHINFLPYILFQNIDNSELFFK